MTGTLLLREVLDDDLPTFYVQQEEYVLTPTLEAAGDKAWGEFCTHNIHIYAAANLEVERHVALCAYLRVHADTRAEYKTLKRQVYAQHPTDIMAYNDGKDAWIKALQPVAIAWYRQQDKPTGYHT